MQRDKKRTGGRWTEVSISLRARSLCAHVPSCIHMHAHHALTVCRRPLSCAHMQCARAFFFPHLAYRSEGRLAPFSSALNLLRCLCLYAPRPLHLCGSDAKIHKGFNSQTADEESERKERKEEERREEMRRGEEKRGHHTLSTITETSSRLSQSLLSGSGSLRKYSRDPYLLLHR